MAKKSTIESSAQRWLPVTAPTAPKRSGPKAAESRPATALKP